MALICLATLPLAIWPAFKSRERVQPPPDQKKIPVRGQLLTLLKNPPIIIISVVMMTFGFIGFGRSSMMMYYFTYVLGNPKVMSLFGLVSMAGSLAGNILIMPALYRALHSKGPHRRCGPSALRDFLPSGIRGYPRRSGILGSDVLRGRLYGHVQFRTVQYARRRGGLRRVEGGPAL